MHRGVGSGVAAYVLWGLLALYWPLLEPAEPLEVLAHRFVWALLVVVALLAWWRRWSWIGELAAHPRKLGLLALAGVAISVNWGAFIWGVSSHHVVEASLGYFINPLVSVLFGVLVFRERLRRVQWAAVAIAGVAVLVLAVGYGQPPWLSFALALSFGTYGLLKKSANMGATASMAVETAVVVPAALGYLIYLEATGTGTFGHLTLGHSALLVSTGLATAVPLLFFGTAAVRIPLSMVGLLQYITPTLHFLIGVFVMGEPMPPVRLAGFALVWVALTVFSTDALRHTRRAAREEMRQPPQPDSATRS